jgi:hypothetical protein
MSASFISATEYTVARKTSAKRDAPPSDIARGRISGLALASSTADASLAGEGMLTFPLLRMEIADGEKGIEILASRLDRRAARRELGSGSGSSSGQVSGTFLILTKRGVTINHR